MKNKSEAQIVTINGKTPKKFFLDFERKVQRQQKKQDLTFSLSNKSIIDHYQRICRRNLPHRYKCCQNCPFKNLILKVVSHRDHDDPKAKITVD